MNINIDIKNLPPAGRRLPSRDLAVLLAVPVVLGAVFVLPESLRRSLVFAYTDPSPVTAYVAPFVHLDTTHLLVNVLGYAVVVPTIYALATLSGTRRRFWVAFVTFVVVFPPVLSYLNLAILRPTVGYGFSGVLLAFVGYLPIALADFATENLDAGPPETVSPTVFFLGLALVAVLGVQSVVPENRTVLVGTSLLVVATLLSAVAFYVSSAHSHGSPFVLGRVVGPPGYFELFVVASGLFVGMLFVAFPAEPFTDRGVVNLYVHLLGYALGFTAPYATLQVGPVPSVAGRSVPGPPTAPFIPRQRLLSAETDVTTPRGGRAGPAVAAPAPLPGDRKDPVLPGLDGLRHGRGRPRRHG